MAANDIVLLRENASARFVNQAVPPVSSALDANGSPTIVAGTDAETLIYSTTLTADRVVTCSNTGAWKGARFRIVRTDTAAQTLTVKDNSAVTLKVIPNSTAAFVDVIHNGTDWKLAAYGTL